MSDRVFYELRPPRPALNEVIDWIIGEAAHSGAGLSDQPTVDEAREMILEAIGFTDADVKLLEEWRQGALGPTHAEWSASLVARLAKVAGRAGRQ